MANLQRICNSFRSEDTYLFLGRMGNNASQYAMVLYAAKPDITISPLVVIVLGSVAFLFSTLDVIIDFFITREHELAERCLRGS